MRIRNDVEWNDVALDTVKWMKAEGFVKRPEEHQISTFVREQWAEEFGHVYGVLAEDWPACYYHLYRLGYYVGFTTGFFLSDNPRDVATSMARIFNTAMGLLHTYFKLIEALQDAGSWNDALPGFMGIQRMEDWTKVEQLLDASEIQGGRSMRQALIEAKKISRSA